jgi:penicillin-binding protein 2
MGIKGIMEMVDELDLNRQTGIDLPHELVSWTPSPEFKRRFNPHDPEWKDIDTVYASFGQVYDIMTPISMLRAVAGIGMGGRLYVPHLLKEVKPIGALGEPGQPDYRPERSARTYADVRADQHLDDARPNPKVLDIPEEQHHLVVEGMWGVVNNGGTAAAIKMANFDIAGKTGTAQVVGLGKDVGANKDHSWFVSYAPAFKPEIAAIVLVENVGFGASFAAPAARGLYDVYYRKTRGDQPAEQVAERPSQVQSPKSKVGKRT